MKTLANPCSLVLVLSLSACATFADTVRTAGTELHEFSAGLSAACPAPRKTEMCKLARDASVTAESSYDLLALAAQLGTEGKLHLDTLRAALTDGWSVLRAIVTGTSNDRPLPEDTESFLKPAPNEG